MPTNTGLTPQTQTFGFNTPQLLNQYAQPQFISQG